MDSDLRRNIGSRIKTLRIQKGMSQEQLAIRIGNSSKQYISALEHGAKNVTIDVLGRIAEALEVELKVEFDDDHALDIRK